jgi:hypothetical protein
VKKFLLAAFLLCSAVTLFAQGSKRQSSKEARRAEKRERISAMVKQEEEGVLAYYKQSAFGVQLRTNGFGAFYELGRMKTPRRTNLYSLEFTEIKHNKEERVQNTESFFSNSFVYGKVNNFYQFKLGYGKQYIFGQKGNKNGIAVMGIYKGGFSAGLLKPYYLNVDDQAANAVVDIKYIDNKELFLDPRDGIINGSSRFSKGLNELSFNPGAFVKAALRFDFGRFNESIQALEIGISADVYSKKVELMALNDPQQFFFQGHLAYIFGRRR